MDPRNTQEKNFRSTKYSREKNLDPRNTHEKKIGPTKYSREKHLDPRNTHTHEKNIWTHEIGHTKYSREKKIWTHEILTRRNLKTRDNYEKKFGPTKYPKEKI